MLQINRVEKLDEENRVIYLVSVFVSCVMVLKLSKKVHFLQLWFVGSEPPFFEYFTDYNIKKDADSAKV